MKKLSVLFLFVCYLLISNNLYSQCANFSGKWESTTNNSINAFTLELFCSGNTITGKHCSIANYGKKMDCTMSDEFSIEGNMQGDSLILTIESSFSLTKGRAVMKFITSDQILWRVIEFPSGEHYIPGLTILKKSATEIAYYNFNDLKDKSPNRNNLSLQEEAIISDGKLILAGGSPWDYMHPHATVANSPSLNPQYITVAARLKPQDFYGCGNDAIVNKPFTSHTAPYYQYHLGICGTYCGGGGYYFSFACSINGVGQGMYSTPNVWVPDQWYTVIGTYDGSTMKLFVNGALVASKAVTGTIDSFDTDEFIGKHGNVDYSIPAEIDWVKVYNRALTNAEVAALGGQ